MSFVKIMGLLIVPLQVAQLLYKCSLIFLIGAECFFLVGNYMKVLMFRMNFRIFDV